MKIPIVDGLLQLASGTNRRTTLILSVSVVVIATWKTVGSQDFYHRHLAHHLASRWPDVDPITAAAWYQMVMTFLLLGIIPACLTRMVFGQSLASVGLGPGRLWPSIALLLISLPVIVGLSYLCAARVEFRAIYPLNRGAAHSPVSFAAHVASLGLFYLGWEFHFRGFLQHALGASLGPAAGLWIQVLASCLLHFDRPDAELWASIPAAVYWGLQANYTGAVWTGVAQHWLLGATLDYFICYG